MGRSHDGWGHRATGVVGTAVEALTATPHGETMTYQTAPTGRDVAGLGDAALVLRTRSGDTEAFGELWRRHYHAGVTVARSVSSSLDPDELTQESFSRIYQSIASGAGPSGSFRAFLFTSIRNSAATWGRAQRETAIEVTDAEDPLTAEHASAEALDRGLTTQAFRRLPSRWQEVLWYIEIEQMTPAEAAPLLGMKPTAVAQLAARAQDGLREAWIDAHVHAVPAGSACEWTVERLGDYARSRIRRRDRARVESHLAHCTRCTIVAGEAHEVSHRLALVLLPLTVGIAGTAGYLAALQGGGLATAAPAMPDDVAPAAGATTATGVATAPAAVHTATWNPDTAGSGIGGVISLVAASAVVVGSIFAGALLLPWSGAGAPDSETGAAAMDAGIDVRVDAPGQDAPSSPAPDSPAPDRPLDPIAPDDDAAPDARVPVTDAPRPADEPDPAPADGGDAQPLPPAGPTEPTPTDPTPTDPKPTDPKPTDPEPTDPEPSAPGASGETPKAALPAGAPAVSSSAVSTDDTGAATLTLGLRGEPGATVRARIAGTDVGTVALDASGAGTLVVTVTEKQVATDARIELRYVAGNLSGAPIAVRVGTLL